MHKTIIGNWNSLVSPDDIVYFLGDFCFVYEKSKSARQRAVLHSRDILGGKLILIQGNHDHKVTRKHFQPDCHVEFEHQIGNYNCILAHRPLYPDDANIPTRDITNYYATKARYEKYDFIISGHIHEQRLWTGRSLNVGVDMHDYKPISEAKVLSLLEEFIKQA